LAKERHGPPFKFRKFIDDPAKQGGDKVEIFSQGKPGWADAKERDIVNAFTDSPASPTEESARDYLEKRRGEALKNKLARDRCDSIRRRHREEGGFFRVKDGLLQKLDSVSPDARRKIDGLHKKRVAIERKITLTEMAAARGQTL
jgi:hypothetical protein